MSNDKLLEWKLIQLVMLLADTMVEEQDEYNHEIGELLKQEIKSQYDLTEEKFRELFSNVFNEFFVIQEQEEQDTNKMN